MGSAGGSEEGAAEMAFEGLESGGVGCAGGVVGGVDAAFFKRW